MQPRSRQRRYSNSSELSYLDLSPPQAHTLPHPPPLPPRGTLRVSPNAHSPNPAPTTNDYRPPLPPRNRSEAGRKLRRSNARSRSGATTPEGPPPLRPARSRSLSLGRFRSPEPSYTGHAFYDPIPVAAPLPNNGNLGTELHDNEGKLKLQYGLNRDNEVFRPTNSFARATCVFRLYPCNCSCARSEYRSSPLRAGFELA